MIRKITLLFLACLGINFSTYAQKCGFDEIHQSMMNQNSAYAQAVNLAKVDWGNYIANKAHNPSALLTTLPNGKWAYEIPIVVHIMYTNEKAAYNPSNSQVQTWVNYLNDAFQATWGSYPDTTNGGKRVPIVFKLAARYGCSDTLGIIHHEVTSTSNSAYYNDGIKAMSEPATTAGAYENTIKNLSRWNIDEYYNIWVVNKIEGNDGLSPGTFTAGYAYLPFATSATLDGTVVLASQVATNRITIVHELGHALGLYHTFQGSIPPHTTVANCPNNTNCATQGDEICDTEPHLLTSGCPSSSTTNLCTGNPYNGVQFNFMNYTTCQNRYTPDQSDRMVYMLKRYRGSLIYSLGATPMPTNPVTAANCAPTYGNPTTPTNNGPRNIVIHTTTDTVFHVQSSGYTGDGNQVYRDLTCSYRATLQAGTSYTFNVSALFNETAKVYIDYNNDGILGNSAGESFYLTSGSNPYTASHTVPTSSNVVFCTPLRMRVISQLGVSSYDSCGVISFGQAEDYEVIITGGSGGNGTVIISNPPTGGNPSCFGTTLTFHSTVGGGVTATGYQWYRNSTPISAATADSLQSNAFLNNDTIWVEMYYSTPCGFDTATSNKVVVYRVVSVAPQVTIGVTGGTNPSCIDDTVVYSVVSNVNPGGGPTYDWYRNGTKIPGASGPSYTKLPFQFNAGDVITCVMHSSAGAPCATPDSGISNGITVGYTTKVPIADIALTIGTNPGCAGQILQFSVTPTTGGTSPSYQWFVNGSPILGQSGTTFQSNTLNNGDKVTCVMNSNSPCASPSTVISDTIEIIHKKDTADITITQVSGTNPACSGKPIIFGANTVNAGSNPTFQWLVNGVPQAGAVTPVFTTSTLANNDVVSCVLIATDPCVANPRDTSNGITMAITISDTPKVSIAITQGKNPGCLDSLVEFTATATNIGTNPAYSWVINNVVLPPSNNTFSSTAFLNGDVIRVRAHQTDGGCYIPDTVFSSSVTLQRSPTPDPPLISLVGNKLVTDSPGTYIWYGPSGRLTGGEDGVYLPTELGPYYAVTNNNECYSLPSNILTITLLDVTTINLDNMSAYPNPTSGEIVLDWGTTNVNMQILVYNPVGQVLMTDSIKDSNRKTVDLSKFANGIYYIVLNDNDGGTATIKITLAK